MPLAELTIGTTTDRINLLSKREGYHLHSWRPVAGDHASTFTESAAADLRQLVQYRDLTTIESFELDLTAGSQDAAIRHSRTLRQMLRKALDYWATGYQTEPVYIKARASCEEETRYAVVYDARLGEDDNPYAPPFIGAGNASVGMESVALVVERGPWLDQAPGSSTCVEVSGQGVYSGTTEIAASYLPTAQTDDCYVDEVSQVIQLALGVGIGMNLLGELMSSGIRFRNVTIPAGSIVLSAYVQLNSTTDDAGSITGIISGENEGTPAVFSTYQDFWLRPRTAAKVNWPLVGTSIEAWTIGVSYDTPDLAAIIQEIIDRSDWVSGNDLVIFLQWVTYASRRQARSFDSGGAIPELFVTYVTNDDTYGRTETCDDEVFLANKGNMANITNVYTYQVGVGWATLRDATGSAAYPWTLIRNAAQTGDLLILGCNTDLYDSGPFNSAIFDLATALTYTLDASIELSYWNGAWIPLVNADLNDETSDGTGFFTRAGVRSICWEPQSDWVPVALNAAGLAGAPPAVSGYWVKFEVTLLTGAIGAGALQDIRDIYTPTWASIMIDGDQIGGDIPALALTQLQDHSTGFYYDSGLSEGRHATRVLAGLRDTARGADFSAYLNSTDEQNPPGIVVSLADTTGRTSFVLDTTVASGYRVLYDPAGAIAIDKRLTWTFDERIVSQYYGVYHVFLRAQQVGGAAGDIDLQLRATIGSEIWASPIAYFPTIADPRVLDFGRLDFGSWLTDEVFYWSELTLYIGCSNAAPGDVYIYDLVLMPVDEWAADYEFVFETGSWPERVRSLGYDRYLRVDGLNTKHPGMAHLLGAAEALPVKYTYPASTLSQWQNSSPGPYLQPRKTQKLWFFTMAQDGVGEYKSTSWPIYSLQMWRVLRYLSMRGED